MADLIGQTLDEKYKIERELGRGGMGTVYLATHLGTERPVAIKVVAPQFMQRPEFVERFRREARAAGRLRHPNVVDVTDFGFAQTADGTVAYLVMEYLDGCTLGEILDEEKNMPVGWTLDILEQICSAVGEAHRQGIIHRDLKPDNIWLEPNQRGGYTVKVLDFGIAKLEESASSPETDIDVSVAPQLPTAVGRANAGTIADVATATIAGGEHTMGINAPGAAAAPAIDQEAGTMLLPADTSDDQESVGTRLIGGSTIKGTAAGTVDGDFSSADLTRVGAVLGTPMYMSPEQCRGDRLDARSDIYSIGVIGYQMLSGETPFKGSFSEVMEAHKSLPAPPLRNRKIRRKLRTVVASALAKDPADRPQTAESFANKLHSRSEGIFGLLRRAGMIYTEHMRRFITLAIIYFVPIIIATALLAVIGILRGMEVLTDTVTKPLVVLVAFSMTIVTAFCTYLIVGTTTWLVTQHLSVPLRPLTTQSAFAAAKTKWRKFATTGVLSTIVQMIAAPIIAIPAGLLVFGVLAIFFGVETASVLPALIVAAVIGIAAFVFASVYIMLVAPVVMMENTTGIAALKRSYQLVRRSAMTSLAAFLIMFVIPIVSAGLISLAISQISKSFDATLDAAAINAPAVSVKREGTGDDSQVDISIGTGARVKAEERAKDPLKHAILDMVMQIILLPIQIVTVSFTAIMIALLYIKTRQAGGESMHSLISSFEDSEQPLKKWQSRMNRRLHNSGRSTPKTL